VLTDDLYPLRRNFIFCHELAHILLGHTTRTTKRIADERDADRLAADLMLPEEEFRLKMSRLDYAELKLEYPHASWEVVARRWAQFRPAVLTIFDNGKLTNRLIPPNLAAPPRPTEPELTAARKTYEDRSNLTFASPPLKISSYFIDDGRGVERVILLTEVEEWE